MSLVQKAQRLLVGIPFLLALSACASGSQNTTFNDFIRGAGNYKRRLAYPMIFGPHSNKGAQEHILSLLWAEAPNPDHRLVYNNWKIQAEETSAPAVSHDGVHVFVGGADQRLACLEARSGKNVWTRTLQGRIAGTPYQGSVKKTPPKASDTKTPSKGPVKPSPSDEDILFVGTTSGMIYALHKETGKTKWKYQAEGEVLSNMDFLKGSKEHSPTLFVTTGNDQLYALHAEDGKLLWRHKHESTGEVTLSVRGQSPPTVHEDKVYTGFSDGTIAAFQTGDGSVVWQKSLRERDRFMDVDSALVVRGAYIYAVSYNTGLHALRLKDGTKLWSYKMQGANHPTFHEDKLYISNSEGRVACLFSLSGNKVWERRYKHAGAFSPIHVTPSYLFLSGNRSGLYVLHRATGHVSQILQTSRGISSPPVTYGQRLFVFANSGYIFAFSMGLERRVHFSIDQ
ncbi:MAG: PQQ-binding-like beta-propeller repeat protein [Myxococcales bacterium]|nr:PQQ-binding-like beta-propeller repeat protein [Myxococcales bacterium]MCB9642904.1 PQQ-binding-like beta-propeller repeat protein [Myxococcales bacterium]